MISSKVYKISYIGLPHSGKLTTIQFLQYILKSSEVDIKSWLSENSGRFFELNISSSLLKDVESLPENLISSPYYGDCVYRLCSIHGVCMSMIDLMYLLQDANGVIFTIDLTLDNLGSNIEYFEQTMWHFQKIGCYQKEKKIPWVIQINVNEFVDENHVRTILNIVSMNNVIPVVFVSLQTGNGIKEALFTLLQQITS